MKRKEILILILLAAGLILWALWPKAPGCSVSVTVDGAEAGRYALDTPAAVPLSGYGGFSLVLVIQDGAAHVEDSTCPDLICQHHASVSAAGEQIICLPARIVITVTGEEETVDAVAR